MDLQNLLLQRFPDFEFHFAYPLSNKSYFKIGGLAEVFYSAKTRQQAIDLLLFCQKQQIKFSILGGSSNVIIADEGVSGLVLSLDFVNLEFLKETTVELTAQADCGIKTSALVGKVVARNATGLEGFIGVPGVLGGAIYNNAHYLGNLIGDYVSSVEALDLEQGQMIILTQKQCQFAYERSIFQQNKNLVIFSVTFVLQKATSTQIKAKVREAMAKRESSQPLDLPSCGCVFQNPPNNPTLQKLFPQFEAATFVPAGFLIEQAGFKGVRDGDIQVSEKHAAFFVNLGQGKASQVKRLIERVKQAVQEQFATTLQEEVFYLN